MNNVTRYVEGTLDGVSVLYAVTRQPDGSEAWVCIWMEGYNQ